jgi:hypothetical protein
MDHMIFVTATQLCYYSVIAAIDNMQMNVSGHVPIKLYFKKARSLIRFVLWAVSNLLTLKLETLKSF